MFIRAATYSGRVALSIRHASFHHATSVYLISILHQSECVEMAVVTARSRTSTIYFFCPASI
jgi:hypothetical protein